MSVRITWEPYTSIPDDVTEVVVVRSASLNNELDFETELNANGRDSTAITFLTSVGELTGQLMVDKSSYTDYTNLNADEYYYCVAAKNDIGYTVGKNGAQTVAPSSSGVVEGGVARIDIS